MSAPERELIVRLLDDLRTLILAGGDQAILRRLFPPAYHQAVDTDAEAEYQRLMHDELVAADGLYAHLGQWEGAGLVAAHTEPQEGRPPRKVYRLTAEGQAAFHAWLRQPAFADELRRLEGLALQSLGRRLMALGELAHAALFDELQPTEPMSNRLRAASIVTERGPALSEITAILARIEQLERRQDEK